MKVSFNDLDQFITHLFDQTYIEGFFYGNMTEQHARQLTNKLTQEFNSEPYPKQDHPKEQVIMLPQEQGPFHVESKAEIQGNALILAIELEDNSTKSWAAQQILMKAIEQPFFSELRTKQQTGYLVSCRPEDHEHRLFNMFSVQSSTHNGRDLLARFEQFIEGFLQELSSNEITVERFDNIKHALLLSLRQPPTSASGMASMLHGLAFYHDNDFDIIAKRIKSLEELSYDEFLDLAEKMLGKSNKRRLAVIFSGKMPTDNTLQYNDPHTPGEIRQLAIFE